MDEPRSIESELKIPVASLEPVRDRLRACDAEQIQVRARECNTLFDDSSGSLSGLGQVLRLRSFAGRWILTFKGAARYQGRIKQREELEVGIDSGEALDTILRRIGLRPLIRYEKDRELWRLSGVEVALDHTPMGDFVELEGTSEHLATVAEQIGLDPAAAVRGSYISLWTRYRQQHQLPFDMTFEDE
jgi:adenylate cyclase class 2